MPTKNCALPAALLLSIAPVVLVPFQARQETAILRVHVKNGTDGAGMSGVKVEVIGSTNSISGSYSDHLVSTEDSNRRRHCFLVSNGLGRDLPLHG